MTKEAILKFLKEKKKEFADVFHIKEIGLFGSYSREEHDERSDIDIVYILQDGKNFGYFDLLDLEKILSKKFKKRVELVNYRYMNPIIKHNAEKEIVYV